MWKWMIPFLCVSLAMGQTRKIKPPPANLAHKGGPSTDAKRETGVTPHIVLDFMFKALEKNWFGPAYEKSQFLDYRLNVDGILPSQVMRVKGKQPTDTGTVDFDVTLDGVAAPNGRYRTRLEGGLGEVEVTHDGRRTIVASDDFKSFSDTPVRSRKKGANLANWRSYFRKHMGAMRHQILESGSYRTRYKGSGTYRGAPVDIINVYKHRGKLRQINKKQPINLRKIWTFWQDGSYDIWVYRSSRMPAAIFYTNTEDNIFTNMTFEYDRFWRPKRINYNNNAPDGEGSGDVVFTFDNVGKLTGLSLQFDGSHGISLRLDATLAFLGRAPRDAFRAIPPFGYRKINRDHLKLMVLTQISGGLLKLKKHGVNLRNFKF